MKCLFTVIVSPSTLLNWTPDAIINPTNLQSLSPSLSQLDLHCCNHAPDTIILIIPALLGYKHKQLAK